MFVWGMLWLPGVGVVEFHSKVGNVVIHSEADCVLEVNGVVVPIQINAGVQVSLIVLGYFVVFCGGLFEM